jgi:hypothetical protein
MKRWIITDYEGEDGIADEDPEGDWVRYEDVRAAISSADDEICRLAEVLVQTHKKHCTEDWIQRRRHHPDCLLYELD